MPRSRRRKGVKPHPNRGAGFGHSDWKAKRYYDPGSQPQPKNFRKHVQQKPYRPKGQRGS